MYGKLQFVASENRKHDKLKFVVHLRARLGMSLKQQIAGDMVTSMKAKDAARTSTLRMLKSAIGYREIEKGAELDNEELAKLLRSQLKQRRDSVEQYEKGGRQDL